MNYTLLLISAALSIVFTIVSSTILHVQAQSLTLPVQYTYAGLTFLQPLTYSDSTQPILSEETLNFGEPETLASATTIASTEPLDAVEESILTPTLATIATNISPIPEEIPLQPTTSQTITASKQTVQPTPTIYVMPTKAPSPTPTPTSKIQPTPTTAPAQTVVAASTTQTNPVGGLDPEKLFNMSNAFRASRGLPPFQKDERACALAASRAPEVAGEVASGNMHAGLRARALPYWNTENIISMRTEEAAFNWWVNDKIHHDAIVGNYTYSCVACSGNSCAQEFTNFQPK